MPAIAATQGEPQLWNVLRLREDELKSSIRIESESVLIEPLLNRGAFGRQVLERERKFPRARWPLQQVQQAEEQLVLVTALGSQIVQFELVQRYLLRQRQIFKVHVRSVSIRAWKICQTNPYSRGENPSAPVTNCESVPAVRDIFVIYMEV